MKNGLIGCEKRGSDDRATFPVWCALRVMSVGNRIKTFKQEASFSCNLRRKRSEGDDHRGIDRSLSVSAVIGKLPSWEGSAPRARWIGDEEPSSPSLLLSSNVSTSWVKRFNFVKDQTNTTKQGLGWCFVETREAMGTKQY